MRERHIGQSSTAGAHLAHRLISCDVDERTVDTCPL